jgi:BirA family biotin operon repressor/biotin-[acetyl-CoA-carboxylase] ligase
MFNVQAFQERRKSVFGTQLYYFENLESTNTTAEELAKQGCSEGTVVLANCQTQGRGRKGNPWHSPGDVNLYFSLIVRPKFEFVHYLPFIAGLAVLKICEDLGLRADLKWPNDILIAGKKVSGILVQTAIEDKSLEFAIIGCGINVNLRNMPEELKATATSLALETGSEISRESTLASFLSKFEEVYEQIDSIRWENFSSELEKYSTYIKGCDVQVHQNGTIHSGTTAGLDPYGGLLVKSENNVKVFYAGEIEACRRK